MPETASTSKARLTESMEDYLEEIYDQTNARQVARVRDIASALKVSMSSVTGALKKLARRQLVNYDRYQYITLTDEGKALASRIKGRHRILARFLQGALGLDAERAAANACRMEHALDQDVIDRFLAALEFVQADPSFGPEWLRRFRAFCEKKASRPSPAHAPSEVDLTEMSRGDSAVITRIEHAQTGDSRIARLGLLPGTSFTVQSDPSDQGAITIQSGDSSITLSRDEGVDVHARRLKSVSKKCKPRH